jgi:hypothetical protein
MRSLVVALAGVAVLAACSDRSDTYQQTWPSAYEETTCAEWTTQMSDDQQFAAAADLMGDHLWDNGATERPDYQPILDFQSVLGQACAAKPTASVAEVAARIGFPD